ncbi:MAG: transcriptional regulator [Desulfobacterales bacterium]
MATIRQQIIEILLQEEMDARQISQALGLSEKEVYDHLPHISKSLSKQGKKLKTVSASCISCGYSFKNRNRMTKPGKCPVCKSERIENPRFKVK